MKDSKDYSPKVTKLFRSLKRKSGKVTMPTYEDPVQAIVDAMVFEHMTQVAAVRTLKRMKNHFVDLNDLRVSRKEEILDIFKDASEGAEKSATAITQTLNTLFEKHNKVTLDFLCHEGKRQARKDMEEIEGITSFAVNYCFLTALDGHAIPLNPVMLQYLRDQELVHPEANEQEIAGFLERQIAAADAYTFYALLREEAEQAKPVVQKKATVKTAKKKTTTKKKTIKKKTVRKKKTTKKKETKKK
jgi:hypothetical protein